MKSLYTTMTANSHDTIVMQVYGSSNLGKDMRLLVQKLNTMRGKKEEAELHEFEQENTCRGEDFPAAGD